MKVGIMIPRFMSTSENIQEALKFAEVTSSNKMPVLIIFFAHNAFGYKMKRLGS